MPGVPLHLPAVLRRALWAHVERELPRECVGAVGGWIHGEEFYARALYPLPNVAPAPEREYLAEASALLRALRAMQAESLTLVALYHSHPRGPDHPSVSDTSLAAYPVPYLIADVSSGLLQAYLLPGGSAVPILEQADLPKDAETAHQVQGSRLSR